MSGFRSTIEPLDRTEHVRHGLGRFDLRERLPGMYLCADVRQIHVHHITERVLREVCDPDANNVALGADPFMFLRVAKVVRILHGGLLPLIHSIDLSVGNDSRSCARRRAAGRVSAVQEGRRAPGEMSPTPLPLGTREIVGRDRGRLLFHLW
jgi:hypothetical protein